MSRRWKNGRRLWKQPSPKARSPRADRARRADRIIVLQNGRLIETGNHDALMAGGGLYAKLYDLNYASFDDIPDEELAATAADGSRT